MSRLSATQQKKYLGKLRGAERAAREAEILYRREHRSDEPFVTDEGQPTKRSKHAAAFERKYGRAPKDTADAARLSGVPKKTLDEVYARGMAAWQTGHRPGASQHAWAMARVESFLTGGPTSRTADADLAREVMVRNPTSYPVKRLAEGKYTLQVNGLTFVVRQSWADRRWHIDVFSPRMVEEFGLEYGTPFAQLDPQPTKRAAVDAATDAGLHREQYPDLNLRKERANDHMMFETEMGLDALNRAREYARRNPEDQTETPAFKAWFGNSKVVDAQGRPLVVYHGTRAQFTAFDKRYVRDQLGFHFGTKGQAKRAPSGKGKGSHVDAYWLSIQNPLRVRDEGSWTTEAAVDAINRASGLRIRYGARDAEIVRALQAAGYDGIVYSNRFEYSGNKDFGVDSWIAFEPTQIKSATGNLGTFDPHDADIRNPASQTHIPPAPVAAAAKRGLALRAIQPPSNRCCTSVGLRRASQLANRQPVSEDTMRRMLSYFQRHEVDKKGKDWNKGTSKGLQAWLCWGGDEGYAWVRRVLGV